MIKIFIKKFQIKLKDQEELIDIPYDVFLKKNVKLKNGSPILSLSLVMEYMEVLENFFSKTWFSLDGKNFYRSSEVSKIVVGDDVEISIINPIWTDDNLTNYSKIVEVTKQEPVTKSTLLVEAPVVKSLSRLSDLKKKYKELA